jgi:bloom syndrome protein
MELQNLLTNTFKLSTFKSGQLEIITDIINNNDVLVILQTGSGKSICYQLPALLSDKITIIISPILSLIYDQVEYLKTIIPHYQVRYINGQLTNEEKIDIYRDIENNDINVKDDAGIKILYTTPETINLNIQFKKLLERNSNKINRFIIDEAHCVSNWGHDFRPSYLQLDKLKTMFPDIPIVALTATAPQIVKNDIIKILKLKDPKIHMGSFIRDNLNYQIINKKCTISDLVKLIKLYPKTSSGIVYCLSRATCEDVADKLRSNGINADYYHAGMDSDYKEQIQKDWIENKTNVIVATIAFGMGINKPDVRYVIHHTMPKSMECYYQESGRAGRDGKNSDCIMYYDKSDKGKLAWFCKNEKNRSRDLLELINFFCLNTKDCYKMLISRYFGEYINFKCNTCSNCQNQNQNSLNFNLSQNQSQSPSLIKQLTIDINRIISSISSSGTYIDDLDTNSINFYDSMRLLDQLISDKICSIDNNMKVYLIDKRFKVKVHNYIKTINFQYLNIESKKIYFLKSDDEVVEIEKEPYIEPIVTNKPCLI